RLGHFGTRGSFLASTGEDRSNGASAATGRRSPLTTQIPTKTALCPKVVGQHCAANRGPRKGTAPRGDLQPDSGRHRSAQPAAFRNTGAAITNDGENSKLRLCPPGGAGQPPDGRGHSPGGGRVLAPVTGAALAGGGRHLGDASRRGAGRGGLSSPASSSSVLFCVLFSSGVDAEAPPADDDDGAGVAVSGHEVQREVPFCGGPPPPLPGGDGSSSSLASSGGGCLGRPRRGVSWASTQAPPSWALSFNTRRPP
ncbi:unnamed protein product, partial [Ixodes pacificus]